MQDLLNQLTIEEFEERYAEWILSGDGDQRDFVNAIIATIRNEITSYKYSRAGEPMPRDAYLDPDDLLPKLLRPKRRKKKQPIDDVQRLAKSLGF